jgi:hypothetical protein
MCRHSVAFLVANEYVPNLCNRLLCGLLSLVQCPDFSVFTDHPFFKPLTSDIATRPGGGGGQLLGGGKEQVQLLSYCWSRHANR